MSFSDAHIIKNVFSTQLLHRGGPFINSLLHLEELGFRSSSATIKKIAFIAWKSLIDNFALNPGEQLLQLFPHGDKSSGLVRSDLFRCF